MNAIIGQLLDQTDALDSWKKYIYTYEIQAEKEKRYKIKNYPILI